MSNDQAVLAPDRWVLEFREDIMAYVLYHPASKRKAWFSLNSVLQYVNPKAGTNVFAVFADAISRGMRPYKTERDFASVMDRIAPPLKLLPGEA